MYRSPTRRFPPDLSNFGAEIKLQLLETSRTETIGLSVADDKKDENKEAEEVNTYPIVQGAFAEEIQRTLLLSPWTVQIVRTDGGYDGHCILFVVTYNLL